MGEQTKLSRVDKIKAKYGEDYFKKLGSKGGRKANPNKGFGCSTVGCSTVGKDGKTGRDRAVLAGQTSRRSNRKKEDNETSYRRTELQDS